MAPLFKKKDEASVDSQISDLIKKDEIPNIPTVIDAIKSGKVDLETIKTKHQSLKSQTTPVKPGAGFNANETTPQIPVKDSSKKMGGPSIDEVLNTAVNNDQIPNIPAVLDSIRSGKVTFEQVKQKHDKFKAENPVVLAEIKPGKVDIIRNDLNFTQDKKSAVELLKEVPTNWDSTVANIRFGNVQGSGGSQMAPDFKQTSVVDFTGLTPGKYGSPSGGNLTITDEGGILFGNLTDDETKQIRTALSDRQFAYGNARGQSYSGQKMLAGATFGIYDPNIDPISKTEAVIGLATEFVTGIAASTPLSGAFAKLPLVSKVVKSGGALGESIQGLKAGKVAAKVLGNTEAAAAAGKELFKLRAVKAATDSVLIGGESFAIGAPVGATKGLLRGTEAGQKKGEYEFKGAMGILEDALVEGGTYAAIGLAAAPVLAGVGSLFKLKQNIKFKKGLKGVVENEAARDALGTIGKSGVDDLMLGLEQAKVSGTITPEQTTVLNGYKKMKLTQPVIGTEAALLSNPEVLGYSFQERAKILANNLVGENGILKGLADSNPYLKTLLDTGNDLEVLDNIQASVTDQIAKDPDAKKYIAAPFMQDASSIHEVLANRVINKVKNPEAYPELKRFMMNYLDQPSAENLSLLEQSAPQKTFKKIKEQTYLDPRLKPQEIDTMVNGYFDNAFKELANKPSGEVFAPKNLGKFQETDSALRAATTFNKELNRSYLNAYMENPYVFDDNFARVKPELMEPTRNVVNLRRLMNERSTALGKRRELTGLMNELNESFKTAADDAIRLDINKSISQAKDKYRTLTTVLAGQNKQINNIQTALDALDSGMKTEAYQFASGVYLPSRKYNPAGNKGNPLSYGDALDKKMELAPQVESLKQELLTADTQEVKLAIEVKLKNLRNQYNPALQNSADFMKRYGNRENPVFINANSELADVMNSYNASGTDISPELAKTFTFKNPNPFLLNIDNPRRQISRELGPNNVVEKMFRKIRDRGAAIAQDEKRIAKVIDDLDIKEGSTLSALTQKIGEGQMFSDDPSFLKLNPNDQKKILTAEPILRGIYNDLIDTMNKTHRENFLPEVRKMDNYYLHFSETMDDFGTKLTNWMRGDTDVLEKGSYHLKQDYNLDSNRTFFASEKRRKGGEYTDDAIGGIKRYIKPALERIYYADLVREIDSAKLFAPQNLRDYLQNIKEGYLLNSPHELDSQATPMVKKAFTAVRSRLGKGAILFNVNSMFQQLLSVPTNFAVSPWDGVRSINQMFTKEGKEILSGSRTLAMRDMTAIDIDRGPGFFTKSIFDKLNLNKAKVAVNEGKKFWEEIGGLGMKTFDKVAASHAYLTGYNRAVRGGATKDQARDFADRWVELIQNDTTKISQPQIYQSTLIKAFGQFQSFLTNFGATIMNDLPNIASRDGSRKAVGMVMRTMAGFSIANETAKAVGIPAPYDLDSFVPFLGASRFGAPGMASAVPDAIKYMFGDERTQKESSKRLKRLAVGLAFPGAGQVYKTGEALLTEDSTDSEVRRSVNQKSTSLISPKNQRRIFGPKTVKYLQKEKAEEQGRNYKPKNIDKVRSVVRNELKFLRNY